MLRDAGESATEVKSLTRETRLVITSMCAMTVLSVSSTSQYDAVHVKSVQASGETQRWATHRQSG